MASGGITPAAAEAGLEALRSGWLTMGPRTEALEAALAERLGAEHVVAVSSGTAALHLSCLALGAGPGSEVVIPALGPRSCAGAAAAAGARAVPHDIAGIDPDPDLVLATIGEATGAVLARHPLGYPADLGALAEACAARGVALIEDCREAIGATGRGEALGRAGTVALLSFSSSRQLPSNEGGAVVTDDEEIAGKVRSLRSHAMTSGTWDRHRGHAETYDVIGVGFNYRIDEVRAAIAHAGLEGLDARVEELRERATVLEELGELAPGALIEGSSPLAVPLVAEEPSGVEALEAAVVEAGARAERVEVRGDGELPEARALAARILLAWL
ncbi:MAG TPA: aminotransferase class I/II-fold pyridoxal phosphate-dependent enzyme [Solirubrobacterales bacterium]|nr:aminotransferase class I/II-fold pyridoxal phosphate-dependent enzyme [Solirubrobacterales bacterium]